MAGMTKGERGYPPEEASDPITPATRQQESLYDRTKESASSLTEKVSESLQPGDTKATTRRLSDTPTGTQATQTVREWIPGPGGRDKDSDRSRRQEQEREEGERGEGKDMLQSAQETVAKALGGGSKGGGGGEVAGGGRGVF